MAPVLMAVGDDGELPARLELELGKRYGADYEIVCEASAETAEAGIVRLWEEGRGVAVVLADQWVSGVSGSGLLARVGELHPQAQRGLLVPWGEWSAAGAVRRAAALGQVEFWTLKPWRSPDEHFLSVIGEALRAWARSTLPRFEVVRVVGEQWSARSHEIRDLLGRNNVPCGFYPAASDQGQRLLGQLRTEYERSWGDGVAPLPDRSRRAGRGAHAEAAVREDDDGDGGCHVEGE